MAAIDPAALDWRFFGGVFAGLAIVLWLTYALRDRPSIVGRMAREGQIWIGVLCVFWLGVIALCVFLTGMDDIG